MSDLDKAHKTRKYEVQHHLHTALGELSYGLSVFGDELAKRRGFDGLDGMDAIHYYLIQKHNWLPSTVRSMSFEDLRFCLNEEMSGWHLPEEARLTKPTRR